MSWLVGSVTPLTRKCPPPPPVSQKSYCVIASPSGSLAVNSEDAAKLCPDLTVTLALAGVTTGGVSGACAVTVKAEDHALHCEPSLARTHNVSVPLPAW